MTADEARDEMLAVFKAAWDTTGYHVVWDDTPGTPPEVDGTDKKPWARVNVQHFGGRQSSLGNADGAKRHTFSGMLSVQVFAPAGDGHAIGYPLATLVLNALRAPRRQAIWYREQSLREQPRYGNFSQINVSTLFFYDDVR